MYIVIAGGGKASITIAAVPERSIAHGKTVADTANISRAAAYLQTVAK